MRIFGNEDGFTLIEVIISLVIAAFVGTILVTFMANSVVNSTVPVNRVQHANQLRAVFEDITSDYKRLSAIDRADLTSAALSTLQGNIDNGDYGNYVVVLNHYILFDSHGDEIGDNGEARILKVTLSRGDQSMTSLFTR